MVAALRSTETKRGVLIPGVSRALILMDDVVKLR